MKKEPKDIFYVIEGKDFIIKSFKTGLIKDCEKITGMDNFYDAVHEQAKEWFDNKFPKCCKLHKEISQRSWFKKERFKDLPAQIEEKIRYTTYHIANKAEVDDWYEDITEYIDYTLFSFGNPPIGSGRYLNQVQHFIKEVTTEAFDFPIEKRQKLIAYIENERNPPDIDFDQIDLNKLYHIHQKWLMHFPNLPFFQSLKKKAREKFPISLALYNYVPNRYSKVAKFSIRRQAELIKILGDLTKKWLNSVDTTELIKKGQIEDEEKHQVEILLELHRTKQAKLVGDFKPEEQKYLETIQAWLENEKVLLNVLAVQLKDIPNIVSGPKQRGKKKKGRSKKKDISFLALFRNNKDRMDKFFKLLKMPAVGALDDNNTWKYERKSSIVACFDALNELGIIKENINKALLRRVIESRIKFKGNSRLFYETPNSEDYQRFISLFEKKLK